MSFKIGMPTILELPDIDSTIAFCKEMKLGLIEIGMTRPAFFPNAIEAKKLRKVTEEHGIEFTIHLPEEFDLANFHQSVRSTFVTWIIDCLNWAKEAGIQIVTMHLHRGIYYTLPNERRYLYNELIADYMQNISNSFKKISAVSKKNNQTVCIENCSNFHVPFIKDTIENLSPFSLTWDVGHDAYSGYKETQLILANQEKVAHMHLHDNFGGAPHRELFTGDVKVQEMIDFAKKKDIRVIVEVKTSVAIKNSLIRLKAECNL